MSKFKRGDIVKLVPREGEGDVYGGKTYHVKFESYRDDGFENIFIGEIIYNEFDTHIYNGCIVGIRATDFCDSDFEVINK